jgi:3-dehydroquinate synthetase
MQAAARIACRVGLLREEDALRQRHLLERLGLELRTQAVTKDAVLARLAMDKKRAGQEQRWILPERVGVGGIRQGISMAVVEDAVETVTSE